MGRNKKKKSDKKQNIDQSSEDLESNIINDTHEVTHTVEIREDGIETSNNQTMKRLHDSEHSDTEEGESIKPKKKKKSLPVPDEATSKKNKKSKRQIKREKYAAKLALEQATAKDQTKLQCLNYLSQWKHDRQNWKFMKAKQVWLHKNKFSTNLIPDASWPLFLEYFESAKGNIKNLLLEDANKIIKQMDEWTESQTSKDDTEQPEDAGVVKPDEIVYNRARSIIQCLQE